MPFAIALALSTAASATSAEGLPLRDVPRGGSVQVRASARVLEGVRVQQGSGAPATGPHLQITRTARGVALIEYL